MYDERLSDDPEAYLARASQCGIDTILVPGDNLATSRLAAEYVKKWDGFMGIDLYCSVGVHPHEASSYDEDTEKELISLIERRDEFKIKAIGEIGLDYYYDLSPRDVQKQVFRRQLQLSHDLDIPIILHERDATADSMEIIKSFKDNGMLLDTPGVCHCCTCSAEIAGELIRLGFYIGFDGPLTFKNNKKTPRTLEVCPMDRIVVETDSPYLTPEPNRGKTNEPSMVPFVIDKIAEYKNMTPEEVAAVTSANGRRLFRIK